MSTLHHRRDAARRRHFSEDEPGVAARLVATLAEWHRRLSTRAELARFGERQLRDLGVTRSDIARECGKPFWRA